MLKRIPMLAVLALFWAAPCLQAKTGPIGSVLAHGELRVNGYAIKGSATAFDGTVIETGSEAQSDADLLLANSTRITLHSNSRGTLYHDHLVLDRGEADLAAPVPYRIEVNGLVVRAAGPNSSRVAIDTAGTVGISTKTGQLEVLGSRGEVLSSIGPQKSQAFSRDANGHWNRLPLGHDKDGGKNGKGEGGSHHHPHPSR